MVLLEIFTRWAADTPPWRGYRIGTCPRCLRAHKVLDTGKVENACRDIENEGFRLIESDQPMEVHRKPLRASDDPKDPQTPWVRVPVLPADGRPPF
jgi:hypothetical protein